MIRRRVYEVVEAAKAGDKASRTFDCFILSLIILNVIAFVAESCEPVHRHAPELFWWFECISIIVFTAEYILRIWSCTVNPKYAHPIFGRLRFALRPILLVDLLAILPFYLPFVGIDLRQLRLIRLTRIFRVMKLARYSQSIQLIATVGRAKREELISTMLFVVILLIFASSLMYFAERHIQPDRFASIPDAMWWAVATLTTVGYGDVYPITAVGKLVAAAIAILGVALFALPTAILGAGFVEEWQRRKTGTIQCPHCGKEVRPP